MNFKNRIRKIEEDMLKSSPNDVVEEYARALLKTWIKTGLIEGPVTEKKVSSITEKIKPPVYHVYERTVGISF